MSEPMDYASAGVDLDLEGSAVASLIGALSKSVRQPGTPGAPVDLPGGFGGLIEFGDHQNHGGSSALVLGRVRVRGLRPQHGDQPAQRAGTH